LLRKLGLVIEKGKIQTLGAAPLAIYSQVLALPIQTLARAAAIEFMIALDQHSSAATIECLRFYPISHLICAKPISVLVF